MLRTNTVVTAFAAAILLAACASEKSPASETCEPRGTSVQVVVSGFHFDTACVAVPADQPFTATLSNEDAEPHNFAVLDEGKTVFVVGARGGDTSTKEGPRMKAGSYKFQCTVHPTMAGGTFIAASP